MKYLGCAYYPEYWGVERVETDAKLMVEAGIKLARIGEFAWARMEPEEGQYRLDWLHQTVEILGRSGVQVMLCTPTATPPAWLTFAYPDTLLVRADGCRAEHGKRRHYCTTSDTYHRFSARITEVLSHEFSRHANVVAWQLDNEFGPEMSWCHCENCQSRFQAWLKERYGSIAELNHRWGTGFWSMDYSNWRQVRLVDTAWEYPSRRLDSRRFWSEMMIDFAMQQVEILRRNHPGALVVTNGMRPLYGWIDYYKLFSQLDVACDDLYFDIATMDADVLAMNSYRSTKPGQAFWVTETGSGALDFNRPPHPEQLRAWAWSSLAHGAEAYVIFRWRTCLSGQEQELQGILEYSGKPRHRYWAVQRCFQELHRLWSQFKDLPLPEAAVALIYDYDCRWGYESAIVGNAVDYPGLIFQVHKALYDRNIVTDLIPPGRALNSYRLVILPSQVMVSAEFANQLKEYVQNGGVLLALGQIGMRDVNDSYLPYPGPDGLQELLGVSIQGGIYLGSQVAPDEAIWTPAHFSRQTSLPLAGKLGSKEVQGEATTWAADLTLNGGSVLLSFSADYYDSQPAVVESKTGAGTSLYVGALRLDAGLFSAVLDYALELGKILPGSRTPEYVEVVQRGEVTFYINHTDAAVDVPCSQGGEAIVGSLVNGTVKLSPFGVCAVRA